MAKLEPLLADLTLPKGARLTAARRAVLAALGAVLLERGVVELYRARVTSVNLRRSVRIRDRAQQLAVRGMAKAGWLTSTPVASWCHKLVFAEPFETIAKRLAGASALREARITGKLEPLKQVEYSARETQWAKARTFQNLDPSKATTSNVLEAWDAYGAAARALRHAEAQVEAAEEALKAEPVPTESEVLAWLVTRALAKPST